MRPPNATATPMVIAATQPSLAIQLRSPGRLLPIENGSVGAPPGVTSLKLACSSLIASPGHLLESCRPLSIGGPNVAGSPGLASSGDWYTNGGWSGFSCWARRQAALRRSVTPRIRIAALICWSTEPGSIPSKGAISLDVLCAYTWRRQMRCCSVSRSTLFRSIRPRLSPRRPPGTSFRTRFGRASGREGLHEGRGARLEPRHLLVDQPEIAGQAVDLVGDRLGVLANRGDGRGHR